MGRIVFPPNSHGDDATLGAQNVTVFGDGALNEGI